MKITNVVPKYEYNAETERPKCVGRETVVLADVPFNIKYIDLYNINEDIFPYADPALLKAIKISIVMDMADQCDFQHADYNKTKISILSGGWDLEYSPRLMVEIFPPDYSEEVRKDILETADKEPAFPDSEDIFMREWSEYNNWLDIFDIVDHYRHEGDDDSHGFFGIEFTLEEEKEFLVFLLEHTWFVDNGNRYLTPEEMEEHNAKAATLKAV